MSTGSSLSSLSVGDVVESVVMGGLATLRARDVPEHRRTTFEVGRAVATGVVGYLASRRAPVTDDDGEVPEWLPVAVAVGGGVTTFVTRGFTQRSEERLDATLARWHVPAPRVVIGLAVGGGHLWSLARERRQEADRERRQERARLEREAASRPSAR